MRAEFFLLGERISMASRARRRWLVVLVYAGLAAVMTGGWFLDHWQGLSAILLYCAASVANSNFFGGIGGFGGLLRPFISKPTLKLPAPGVRLLRWGLRPAPQFNAKDCRNDERELHERDHAHYLAYRVLIAGLVVLWLTGILVLLSPRRMPANLVLFGLLMATLTVALTLPQAILLWTEPDMEAEG
ncbi:MAG: hypothetical protein ABSG51_03700 [Terracidiphilus sp.]|jgi:hypothetical protein